MPSPEKSVPAGFHQWPEARQNDWLRTQFRRMGESRGRNPKSKVSGPLLKAIAEISTKNPSQTSIKWIAERLKGRREFANVSERTLRGDVVKALDWVTGTVAPDMELLPETKKHFRPDALSILRAELAKKKVGKK